jgi:hypothetical protein
MEMSMAQKASEQSSEEKSMELSVYCLFIKGTDRDPSEDLSTIANYFDYLADKIDHSRISINASPKLLRSFESIYLLLQDRLLLYPEAFRNQVIQIIEKEELAKTLAILAHIDIKQARRNNLFYRFSEMLPFLFRPISIPLTDIEVTPKWLLNAKVSLSRLAQILQYVSTLGFIDYDTTISDYKSNYDLDLIDRNKIVALINLLKVQVRDIDDENVTRLILKKVENIEQEIKRPKPRWGHIITAFFILFGFVADLKTLNPQIYDKPYNTISTIVSMLHHEGSVSYQDSHKVNRLFLKSATEASQKDEMPDPPDAILPGKDDEEE